MSGHNVQLNFRFMKCNNIQFPSKRLFFKYQQQMFCSVVEKEWREERQRSIELTKQNSNIIIGGDARCDCMGFCAQYGTYSVMDLTTNRLIDIQPVSVS